MCERTSGTARTFRTGSATLTQCLECSTFAVQIGTAYFALGSLEMEGLTRWIRQVRDDHRHTAVDTVFLQVHQSRVLLALSTADLEDLWAIVQKGSRWAGASGPPVAASPALSDTVH